MSFFSKKAKPPPPSAASVVAPTAAQQNEKDLTINGGPMGNEKVLQMVSERSNPSSIDSQQLPAGKMMVPGMAGSGGQMMAAPPRRTQQQQPTPILQQQQGAQQGTPVQPSGVPAPGSQAVVYPWSQRKVTIPPPPAGAAPDATTVPFPRYGASLPPISTPTGQLFLFGGLVSDSVRSDLFVLECRTLTLRPLSCSGEVPPPRVGHASAVVSQVLIVWGGDTKIRPEDVQDQGIYLLNINTMEWSCVKPSGRAGEEVPSGRYGHAVAMVGGRFCVWGGQVDGIFLDDFWSFDLNGLKSQPKWDLVPPSTAPPPRRTGHILVSHAQKLYLFGGTDGSYHYNDTWCYDVATRAWTELSCIGYLPAPREGHSGCIVDGIIYVFGGRDVNGKDLGDLAAFKISNQRWYMFQNMGPAPSGRSGHAMASYGNKVLVLGGESTIEPPDDPSVIHILDTGKIKYPPDPNRPQQAPSQIPQSLGRKTSLSQLNIQQQQIQQQQLSQQQQQLQQQQRAMSPSSTANGRMSTVQPMGSMMNMNALSSSQNSTDQQHQTSGIPRSASQPGSLNGVSESEPQQTRPQSPPAINPRSDSRSSQTKKFVTGGTGAAPPRPRREDDAAYGIGDPSRSMSPNDYPPRGISSGGGTYQSPSGSISSVSGVPTQQQYQPQHGESPQIGYQSNSNSPNSLSNPTMQPRTVFPPGITAANRGNIRSPSPVTKNASEKLNSSGGSSNGSAQPPADAFYYNPRSPNGTGAFIPGHARPGSLSGIGGAEVLRELKVKEGEVAKGKKREEWLCALVDRAKKAGFVVDDAEASELSRVEGDLMGEEEEDQAFVELSDAVIAAKKDNAALQMKLASDAEMWQERFSNADTERQHALQESAFYRAKIAALEIGSAGELAKLERDRSAQLERHAAQVSSDHEALERQFASVSDALVLEKTLRQGAEEREGHALDRAVAAEQNHLRARGELETLHEQLSTSEATLREHADKVVSLTVQAQQHLSSRDFVQTQHDELKQSVDLHARALDAAQLSLVATGNRAEEAEALYQRERDHSVNLEAEVIKLRNELETRSEEAEAAVSRLRDVEVSWAKAREEADSLRGLSTGGLAEILDHHRSRQEFEENLTRGHEDKVQALEEQASSLRKMLGEAGTRVDESQSNLAEHRKRNRQLELDHAGLRSELHAARTKLASALSDTGRLRDQLTTKEFESRERRAAHDEVNIKAAMLRNMLADNGLPVNEDKLSTSGSTSQITKELEAQLADQSKQHEETRRELQAVADKHVAAQAQVESLQSQVAALKSSGGASSGEQQTSGNEGLEERALAAEKKLNDAEAAHKEKLTQVEHDYQVAVHYVKGSEKMLRRIKDELTKQKGVNASLQSELDGIRGTNSSEAGARTRDAINGRNTPVLDDASTDTLRTKLQDAQRQISHLSKLAVDHQSLSTEHSTLRSEHSMLKDSFSIEQRAANDKISLLENEVDRLRQLSAGGGYDVKRLQSELLNLQTENEQLQQRIALLLDVNRSGLDHPSSASHNSSDTPDFETLQKELHQWERAISPQGHDDNNSDYSFEAHQVDEHPALANGHHT